MNKIRVKLTLPAKLNYVPTANTAAKTFAEECGFAETQTHLISLALEEAFSNALEMGYKGIEDEIEITLTSTSTGVRMVIHSLGLPLNPDLLPEFSPQKALDTSDTRGLSFLLVKKIMDKVSFSVLSSGERQLSMVKHLPVQTGVLLPQESHIREKKDAAGSKLGTESAGQMNHSVRLAIPEDAEDIARTAIQSHGSILFHEDIYYPARIGELIQSKKMVSAVAVTDDNELFGHGALVPHGSEGLTEEMTYGFINPRFQSRGAITDITHFLIENTRKRGVYAINAMAVTSHIHSQKPNLKYGFSETALLVATSTAAGKWNDTDAKIPARIGNMLLIKYLAPVRETTLFAPARHKEIIQEIYSHQGVEVRLVPGEETPAITETESNIISESDLMEGWTLICVLSYGKDVENKLKRLCHEAISQEVPAIQLLLPLGDPATPFFTTVFEAAGFFFAGVGPGDDTREYLALQYINWEDPGYDAIHAVDGIGQKIKDYVIECGKNADKCLGKGGR